MADYIDRKELQKELNDWYDYHYPTASGETDKLHMDINKIVRNLPSVDAVEQKHGHWIEKGTTFYSYCSICGKYGDDTPYCSYCGAKMDEVTE